MSKQQPKSTSKTVRQDFVKVFKRVLTEKDSDKNLRRKLRKIGF